jgi:D-glycero-D-manno-heptose 1,7-bisphosphate phosphatase
MSKKVIFLDRDGTINVDHGYVNEAEQWEWIDGAIEGCKLLQDAGYTLAIVTNQSGIAQGLYTEDAMHKLHAYMLEEFEGHGVHIAYVAFCPHDRGQSDCDCRKPKIGMAKQIEAKIGEIDYANSWIIGDKEADLMFGKNAGTHTALIMSKYWEENSLSVHPDLVVNSLLEAAEAISQ